MEVHLNFRKSKCPDTPDPHDTELHVIEIVRYSCGAFRRFSGKQCIFHSFSTAIHGHLESLWQCILDLPKQLAKAVMNP